MFANIGTPALRRLAINILPWKNLHHMRDISDYMYDLATKIYGEKRRALEEGDEVVSQQIGRGKDLISVLSDVFYLPTVTPRSDIECLLQ